jgi:hypothetical protein
MRDLFILPAELLRLIGASPFSCILASYMGQIIDRCPCQGEEDASMAKLDRQLNIRLVLGGASNGWKQIVILGMRKK